jgi:ABC-type amino acid transport substrate-binding protein
MSPQGMAMIRISRTPGLPALVAALILLSGCSGGGTAAPADATASSPECSDPASAGHIVVGYKTDRPGLTQQNGDDFVGFEPTLVSALAGALHVTVTAGPISTATWGQELNDCTISAAVASISWTGPRAGDYYLTSAYLQTKLGVLAVAGQRQQPDVTDFANQSVCYVASSGQDQQTTAQSTLAEPQYEKMDRDPEQTSDQCLLNLISGRDEFFVSDAAILRGMYVTDYAPHGASQNWSFVENEDFGSQDYYVIALKRDRQHLQLCQELSAEINQYVGSVNNDDSWWNMFVNQLGGSLGDSQRAALENEYLPRTQQASCA